MALSYSQFGEDEWIARNLQWALPPFRQGFFVEVGVCDPVEMSNTFFFEEHGGWNGLLIEPDPRTHPIIRQAGRRAKLIECAAGSFDGPVQFGVDPIMGHAGTLRTGVPTIEVQQRTLTSILTDENVADVDLLSIETEGSELDVWAGLDKNKWRPMIVIIEWCTLGLPSEPHKILQQMNDDRYRSVHHTPGNFIFVSE
jgi:FkbM family methyltransferase